MLTTRTKWNGVRGLAILALAAVPGFSSPIFVSNFSFEDLPGGGMQQGCLGINCSYSIDAIFGWTATGTTDFGQFHPGDLPTPSYFTSLSDGPTSGYANGAGAVLSQTVLPTVVVGEVYTLFVDIGYRLDLGFAGSAALQIGGSGGTTIAATGSQPTRGTFATYTATYTGLAEDLGKSITIDLKASGIQGNFDNVRLDLAPEPVPFMLIGTALLLLPALRRRRTNSKTRT